MALSLASLTKNIEISTAQYGEWSSVLEFSVFLNRIPNQPNLIVPVNNALNQSSQPILTWAIPSDAENNLLNFHLQIDTSETFDSQSGLPVIDANSIQSFSGFSFNAPVVAGSGQASFEVPVVLSGRSKYFWRVRAHDGTRYGDWSDVSNFTVGILATHVIITTAQAYLPVAGMTTTVMATYQDADGNVDTSYNATTTFIQSQNTLGFFNPVIATTLNGVATTTYTSSGALGATRIETASSLTQTAVTLFSVNVDNLAILIAPTDGKRLASQTKPRLTWSVPNNLSSRNMHFKVEIYKSPMLSLLHLVYEANSKDSTIGFSYTNPVPPLSADVWHDVQVSLPDGKYWWRVIPWDGFGYLEPSKVSTFSFPNQMVVVSKPIVSAKPITQAVAMANVSIDIGNEALPAMARHYITNMALETEDEVVWHDVTDYISSRKKFIFPKDQVPTRGWAVAIKTEIFANDATGEIAFNGHGVVFDGDYTETSNEDYIGVVSALTPIAFQAVPSVDGTNLTLSWAYMDLNSENRRIIDKFVIEVYNPATGLYEPYDGNKGEVSA